MKIANWRFKWCFHNNNIALVTFTITLIANNKMHQMATQTGVEGIYFTLRLQLPIFMLLTLVARHLDLGLSSCFESFMYPTSCVR